MLKTARRSGLRNVLPDAGDSEIGIVVDECDIGFGPKHPGESSIIPNSREDALCFTVIFLCFHWIAASQSPCVTLAQHNICPGDAPLIADPFAEFHRHLAVSHCVVNVSCTSKSVTKHRVCRSNSRMVAD